MSVFYKAEAVLTGMFCSYRLAEISIDDDFSNMTKKKKKKKKPFDFSEMEASLAVRTSRALTVWLGACSLNYKNGNYV